ncbi:hypothetical protein ACGF1Z_29685 [Streptomyces sp. NPDC048018]|uniref:hypothetical protein n=1 Tax=Streptomyces sp. NPDC048018 TaxID=3365499 RepID=UPI0037246A48
MPNDPNPNPAPSGPEPKTGEGDPQPSGTPPEGAKTGEGGNESAAELSTERTARAAAEKRAETAEAEAARLRRSNAAQKPGDLDALRDEIRGEFTAQLVRAELRAAAAGKLRDPADALALVDVAALVGTGGDVDTDAIGKAVAALLKAKPYLAVETAPGASAPAWGDVGAGQHDTAEPEPATPLDRLRRAYAE